MSVRAGALADSMQCHDGGWSAMRIMSMLTCVVVFGMWVAFCIRARLIPLTWEMVTLVSGAQAAKAAQLRFELGSGGLPSSREGE